MFSWLLGLLKDSGAFDSIESPGSITTIILTALGLIGSILAIIKKKAKPGSKWERLFTMLLRNNNKMIEVIEKIEETKHDHEQTNPYIIRETKAESERRQAAKPKVGRPKKHA